MVAKRIIFCAVSTLFAFYSHAQTYNQMDESGNITQRNENDRFSHNDTTKNNKEVPKGLYVWTIDRKFGDIRPAQVDTMPHLYPNTTLVNGIYGEYNTIGNNYTPRINRIVIDRPLPSQFIFTQPYDYVMKEPDNFRFTNTLSPYTNISYDNCGDKTNGEDHIDALFAVNAGKKFGAGFDLNYAYARGYYANQNVSHFGATFFTSYLGDRYQMHAMFSTYHQKEALNGGIVDDNYITHPETFDDNFAENEIPTVLEKNWQRNNNQHFFLTHRYSIGFFKQVKMTDEEIKARKFAEQSKKEKEQRTQEDKDKKDDQQQLTSRRNKRETSKSIPMGRPDNAKIAGDEPVAGRSAADDSTRVKVGSQAQLDSIKMAQARQDSIDATMKKVYVPVTSFIHTLDLGNYDRIYQAYQTPEGYYGSTPYYNYNRDNAYSGDSIYDQTKMFSMKNTLAIAMLEGFNKYVKAGLKVFAAHELRKVEMPDCLAGDSATAIWNKWTEHNVSIGGQLIKSQGRTLHFNLMAETWLVGEDAGQLKIDFSTDLNFRFLGDTVTLAAKAYLYRLNPTFYQRRYHSKYVWWNNEDMSKETRMRVEGLFSYRKTHTSLRVAIEEMQNYTYFGVSYDTSSEGRTNMTTTVNQASGNINLMTLQLRQDFRLGPLNWENVITYQNSSNQDVLSVPDLNIFSNLYLKFRLVKELSVELGAYGYYFTKYYAPDFSPQLSQFAVQQNAESRVKIGGYPFFDAYANLHLKRTRFFLMFSHVNAGNGSKEYFLAPHYAQNGRIMRFGVSWNFFN